MFKKIWLALSPPVAQPVLLPRQSQIVNRRFPRMSWFYRNAIRPVLFAQDAESIHQRTLGMLSRAGRSQMACDAMRSFLGAPELPIDLFGLRFTNPAGLG